jgi:16S rRNA (guanine966-N2)-methyltransferase
MAVKGQGRVRIIAGRWRGRRLAVPEMPGLRPTPDRVRETLFNWLQPVVAGARCLDLFAGSGVLGLEALSRGAAEVIAVERNPLAVAALRGVATEFGAEGLVVRHDDAITFLAGPSRPFDLVFLDPPFGHGLLEKTIDALAPEWLARPAWVYVESEPELAQVPLPENWIEHRSARAGDVICRLARVE